MQPQGQAPPAFQIRRLGGVGACLALILASFLPISVMALRPTDPASVAAVFPPWWTTPRVLAAASMGGRLAALGRWTSVVVVRGDAGSPSRLRAAGALFIVDPRAALGCDPITRQTS